MKLASLHFTKLDTFRARCVVELACGSCENEPHSATSYKNIYLWEQSLHYSKMQKDVYKQKTNTELFRLLALCISRMTGQIYIYIVEVDGDFHAKSQYLQK